MSLVLRFAAGSHKGMIREGNEDSGYAGPRLLAVADGMGGQAAGEVASAEVLSTILSLDEELPGTDPLTALSQAADRANERLRLLVEGDPSLEGMGTTLTALLWTGERAGLIHIGDSRAYLLRDGALTQITQDHTWVQRLVDEGRITEEEASTHPQRSLIMRALMGTGEVESDLSIREVRAGDRYLICSDGLSGVVSHQTLEETLGSYYAPEQTIAELIQLALRGGGPDNITCVVADVLDLPDGDPAAGQVSHVPMVVGAVADGPPTISHHTMANTPAARAASLGRPQPQGEPGSANGYGPDGFSAEGYAEGDYDGDEDYPAQEDGRRSRRKQRSGRKRGCLVPSVLALALLAVVGGGYAGYQWTKTQYFIGADGDHVAVYQGVNQNLAGLKLSKVYKDYPQIELKYLPSYQQSSVHSTISATSLNAAAKTVAQLQSQASLCQQIAVTPTLTSAPVASPTPAPRATATPGTPAKGGTPTAKPTPTVSASAPASASLSPQQQQLAQQCPAS